MLFPRPIPYRLPLWILFWLLIWLLLIAALPGQGGAQELDPLEAKVAKVIEGRTVECRPNGEVSHRRLVARCFWMGEDLGRRLVQVGLARDCPRHSGGLYAPNETPEGRRLPLPGYCRQR